MGLRVPRELEDWENDYLRTRGLGEGLVEGWRTGKITWRGICSDINNLLGDWIQGQGGCLRTGRRTCREVDHLKGDL